MGKSALDNLAGPAGQLTKEPPDTGEINGLKRSGLARLKDAGNDNLALESRFDLAYNAGHALALAALRTWGFRPRSRYIVFQVLPHTLGLGPEVWRLLDMAHRKRNHCEYEGQLDVDEPFITELVEAVSTIARSLDGMSFQKR